MAVAAILEFVKMLYCDGSPWAIFVGFILYNLVRDLCAPVVTRMSLGYRSSSASRRAISRWSRGLEPEFI
jgi:hypothetical protein